VILLMINFLEFYLRCQLKKGSVIKLKARLGDKFLKNNIKNQVQLVIDNSSSKVRLSHALIRHRFRTDYNKNSPFKEVFLPLLNYLRPVLAGMRPR